MVTNPYHTIPRQAFRGKLPVLCAYFFQYSLRNANFIFLANKSDLIEKVMMEKSVMLLTVCSSDHGVSVYLLSFILNE